MSDTERKRVSTEPYKGVRDFYPEDWAVQNHIWKACRVAVERFGFEEYNASPLEPSELYKSKTSEEIVNEQTYTFTDRGEREVTLRPEMTPTVARMIAAKRKTLYFPVRWYSIGNMFRYERPQKGRLREHYQLNVDIFGIAGIEGETEAITVAYEIMRGFGMDDKSFEIRINSRKVMNYIIGTLLGQSGEAARKTAGLIDRRAKMEKEAFSAVLSEHLGEKDALLLTLLDSKNFEEFISHLPKEKELETALAELKVLTEALSALGITNVVFDQTLMRGFDYYTGIVFEVFDKHPGNIRSLFGGGRYDNLLDTFGVERVPTVGFAMGDVTIRDVLQTYDLLPKVLPPPAELYLSAMEREYTEYVNDLAQILRRDGTRVVVDYSDGKIATKIKNADRARIPFFAVIGEIEKTSGQIKVKNLGTGKEAVLTEGNIAQFIHNANAAN
ncbi:MAG: Histidine-tRNA ligase [Parcubacteria group bacterium GW2011_GWA2_49_9]|nr:MAG: Histidine-tRNA ligase [Parcubacteria group bacterium GW2011_GWA2_49_9]